MAFAQDDNNNQNDEQNNTVMTGGGQQSLAKGGLAGQPATGPANKQGSGRFTNLSKYVQANQQGAQNLAQRVGTGVQSQLSSKEKEATSKTQEVGSGIQQGQQKLGTASAEEKRLGDIANQFKANKDFSILNADRGEFGKAQQNVQEFVKNNPNYSLFKEAQAGQAVDEAALQNQFAGAQQSANMYQNLFKKRQEQLGTSAGREQALGEFIGGANQAIRPSYNQGQRRLDNLILGQSAPVLKDLVNKVGANQANVQAAMNLAQETGANLQGLTQAEADLQNKIMGTSKAAQEGFQTAFDDKKLQEVNAARQQNYNALADQFRSGNFSTDLYNQLGLNNATDSLENLMKNDQSLGGDIYLTGMLDNPLYADDIGGLRPEDIAAGSKQGYIGLNTYGLLDRVKNSQGDLDQYLTRKADLLNTSQLGQQGDVETDALLSDILGTTEGRKFTQAGDITTAAELAKAASGQSRFLEDVNARRQQAKDLAKQYSGGFNVLGGDENSTRIKNEYDRQFRNLFGENSMNSSSNIIKKV